MTQNETPRKKKSYPRTLVLCGVLIAAPALGGRYELEKGSGIDVCESYRRNLASQNGAEPMACERHYDPAIKGFSSPRWTKLSLTKHMGLLKKAMVYSEENNTSPEGMKLTDQEIQTAAAHLEEAFEGLQTELYMARIDLYGDGKRRNIVAMRDNSCGPHPKLTTKRTVLYVANSKLTDLDYSEQDRLHGYYRNSTIEFYNGHPYFEDYQPDDNWGHLLSGSGRLYVLKPDAEDEARGLIEICEIRYVPSSAEEAK